MRISVRQMGMVVVLLALSSGGLVLRSKAQSGQELWLPPANVSRSGSASQPVIAAAADGTLHVLWWDQFDGEQYVRTANVTGTAWLQPLTVPQIVGERKVNEQTGDVALTAPVGVYLVPDARGAVYALWRNVDRQLFSAQTVGGGWSEATLVAEAASAIDVAADAKGDLHLVYARPISAPGFPSGVYYKSAASFGWGGSVLVYASPYFRAAETGDVHLSVAGNEQGQVLAVWDDLRLGRSFYARSADGGARWSEPQVVSGTQSVQPARARVAAAPNGEFLLLWQDAGAGGCGLQQHRSVDGGQMWSAPERILTGLNRCPERWQFSLGGAAQAPRLWLVGLPAASDTVGSSVILAAWDGTRWSEPVNLGANLRDPVIDRAFSLGCLGASLAGPAVGLAGCDSLGDVWVVRNALELDSLLPALKPAWEMPQTLSDQVGQAGLPALAADEKGKLYALWSQSKAAGLPGVALYAAVWDGARWSRAAEVLRSPAIETGLLPGAQALSKAEQPALAADGRDRLHAVWSGGESGQIFFSWAYVRDAVSARGWSEPVGLPAPSVVGSWPDLVADPRGNIVHVIYAVPYNEKRGIYTVRSQDGGQAWLAPVVVFDAEAAGVDSVGKARVALDAHSNVLHATWLRTTLPGGTGAQAVYYAHSTDGGQSWSVPLQVAKGAVDWPRVVVGSAGQAHLVWNQARGRVSDVNADEVWHQYSTDGGEHWTDPARVGGFEGLSGPSSLVSDGAGRLYLVGVGQGGNREAALLYARWNGAAWGERELFGLGQNAALGNAAVAAILPGAGRLGVALREWMVGQDGAARFVVAVTGRQVTPAPLIPAPTFTPLPAATPTITPTPRPTITSQPKLSATGTPQPVQTGPLAGQSPLALSGALAAIVVVIVMLGRVVWGNRR